MMPRADRWFRRLRSEQGATAVEYALMVTVIALVIIGGVMLLGSNLSAIFLDAGNKI